MSGEFTGRRAGEGGVMRLGDYVVVVSMSLNVAAALAYAWQGHWLNAFYWLAALQINFCAMRLR